MIIETINTLSNIFDALTNIVPKVVALSSMLAAFIPRPETDESFWGRVHKYINLTAFNFKHAKNSNE